MSHLKTCMGFFFILITVFLSVSCSTVLEGKAVPRNIEAAVKRKLPGIVLACHRKELGPYDNNVNYINEVSFYINTLGKVESFKMENLAVETDSPLRETFSCIKRRLRKHVFPKAPKGTKVKIHRNIDFETLFAK